MLTDKTLSEADYDAAPHTDGKVADMEASNAIFNRIRANSPIDAAIRTTRTIMTEPNHKTKRRARRASARLEHAKAMLAYQADSDAFAKLPAAQQEKAKKPIKPRDWRAPKPPQPTVSLWFFNVKQKNGTLTAKLGKIKVTLPDIKEVKTILVARDGTLIRLPISLAKQFGGRVW